LNSRWTGDSRGKALAKPEIVEPTGKNAFVSAELPAASITKEFRTDGLEVRGSPYLQGGILALYARSKIGRGVCRSRPSFAVQTFTSGLVKIRAECALVHSSAVSASPVGLTSIGVWLSSIAGSRLDECLIGQRWMVWSDFRQ
jgi:hypothetical protein